MKRIELTIEPSRQFNRVGPWLLLDPDDDRRFTATRSLAPFEGRPFADLSHIPDEHRPFAAQCHDAVADFFRRPYASNRLQHVLLRPLDIDPGRRVLTGPSHRSQQVIHRDAVRTQTIRVGDNLELPFRATDGRYL